VTEPARPWYRRRWLLALPIACVVAGMIYVAVTGAVTPSSVQAWLESLGPAAPVLFIVAFVVGSTFGLPGTAFVVGARLAFGPWYGLLLAYWAGQLATGLPFLAARALRGNRGEPWRPKNRFAARLFAQLETHPLAAVVGLRALFWWNTAITYGVAWSPIRTRDYLLGCAIGLAPATVLASVVTGWIRG
jgi:uncharacterized membrane protein YdjX (TVP38/TMEM64 family)